MKNLEKRKAEFDVREEARREKKEIISAKKGIRKATAAVQPFPYDWLQSWPQDWFYVVQLAGKPSGQPAAQAFFEQNQKEVVIRFLRPIYRESLSRRVLG